MNEVHLSSSPRSFQVLILEPNRKLSSEIISALREARAGTSSVVARSVDEAQRLVIDQKPDLFVLDTDSDYAAAQEFLYDLRTSHPDARALILTASHFTAQREQVAGLGAIHFLEKPFPRSDFIALTEALLAPAGSSEGERFQGTLSDLHIADIIQLKCISGATSALEFTSPRGEKARVYFENGQVRHATAPGKKGREAFNAVVDWKGGLISEVAVPQDSPRTIDLDWQVLLMEAVRKIDETREAEPATAPAADGAATRTVLVIDDSVMLLSFVKEILSEQRFEVVTAETAEEGLAAVHHSAPDLILLDYVLPDMKGDEVCRKLLDDPASAKIPVVYMSGFGSDLQPNQNELPNVIGALSKPFTSDSLINAAEQYLPAKKRESGEEFDTEPGSPGSMPIASAPISSGETAPIHAIAPPARSEPIDEPLAAAPASHGDFSGAANEAPASSPGGTAFEKEPETIPDASFNAAAESGDAFSRTLQSEEKFSPKPTALPDPGNAYFCGDSSFFPLYWAVRTIAREKLTGILHAFWTEDTVDLLARDGEVLLVTTRNSQLYCAESPVTLLNVNQNRVEAARAAQVVDGCPLFIPLADEGLILREPGMQLVQHYGQRLFAQLWSAERLRFVFKQEELPAYARDLPAHEENIDQWALSTLRLVQYQEANQKATPEPACVPAYTRDGYERVQQLRLTVAETQFASQFNGRRSVRQIAKNLRLDLKVARLTIFRFLALEIVDCRPAQVLKKKESRGGLRGILGR